jgi:fructose-bisphosphate aldolase class II/tagatose 1,6-diphosphate aldolase GatY/KbaY
MPIAKVSDILRDAKARRYGIPAYDVMNYETMRWTVDAAEIVRTPAILMIYPTMKESIHFHTFASMARDIASHASVPVAVHLDHSGDYDEIMEAIDAGFTSVMYDGSKLPFEENVANTRRVVESAHARSVSVEAELGMVGRGVNREEFTDSSMYTSPDQAREFVARTGCDALAVAIGNSHGVYVETPHLDIPRLKLLYDAVSVPLVLHGTSHIPEDQVVSAVLSGITKINIATEFYMLMGATAKKVFQDLSLDGVDFSHFQYEKLRPVALDYFTGKMRLFNPLGIKL